MGSAGSKGRISITYTVWCGTCSNWEYIESGIKATPGARKLGYKLTRAHGWICPTCQHKAGGYEAPKVQTVTIDTICSGGNDNGPADPD